MQGEELNTDRYYKFINEIIEERGQGSFTDGIYYENHHIKLRCFGGEPVSFDHKTKHKNLVGLTASEHFLAHKILYEDNSNCNEIFYAFGALSTLSNGQTIISEQEYENLKIKLSVIKHETHYSKESRLKMSAARKGKKLPDESKQVFCRPNINNRKPHTKHNEQSVSTCSASRLDKIRTAKESGAGSHANDGHRKKVYCIEANKEFEYLRDACLGFAEVSGYAFNSLRGIIKDVCNGKRENICGYHFEWR